ncbi:hypothetical protein ZWY2020_005068 [Hordeum vulgare]|nr:hypothetical protein ZWY2020_005068 [Hordeum vulgare]
MDVLLSGVPATGGPATAPVPACPATARGQAKREMGATATAHGNGESFCGLVAHQVLLFTIPECGRSRYDMVPQMAEVPPSISAAKRAPVLRLDFNILTN